MRPSILLSFLLGAIILILSPAAAWEGINCHGSGYCGKKHWGGLGDEHRDGARSMIQQLRSEMYRAYRVPACRVPPGEVIVCRANFQGAICAFHQNARGGKEYPVIDIGTYPQSNVAPGLNGTEVVDLLAELDHFGCKVCGSVPVGYPHNNDPFLYGVLTVNYVHYFTHPFPEGVQYDCEETPRVNYYSEPFKHSEYSDHQGY